MRLVDDLMEPFRPLVDLRVKNLIMQGSAHVDAGTKRSLVDLLYIDQETDDGVTPLIGCLNRLAISLARVFLGERKSLDLPTAQAPTTTLVPNPTPADHA